MVLKGNVVTLLLAKDSASQNIHDPSEFEKKKKIRFGGSESMHVEGGLLNKCFLDKGYAKTTSRQRKEFPEKM